MDNAFVFDGLLVRKNVIDSIAVDNLYPRKALCIRLKNGPTHWLLPKNPSTFDEEARLLLKNAATTGTHDCSDKWSATNNGDPGQIPIGRLYDHSNLIGSLKGMKGCLICNEPCMLLGCKCPKCPSDSFCSMKHLEEHTCSLHKELVHKCTVCGKNVIVRPSDSVSPGGEIFCGSDCLRKQSGNDISKMKEKCDMCGNRVTPRTAGMHAGNTFCSMSCIEKYNEKENKCDMCGISINPASPEFKEGEQFCSMDCLEKYEDKDDDEMETETKCDMCGGHVKPGGVPIKLGATLCSLACMYKYNEMSTKCDMCGKQVVAGVCDPSGKQFCSVVCTMNYEDAMTCSNTACSNRFLEASYECSDFCEGGVYCSAECKDHVC